MQPDDPRGDSRSVTAEKDTNRKAASVVVYGEFGRPAFQARPLEIDLSTFP
jgi:hypothetical protein